MYRLLPILLLPALTGTASAQTPAQPTAEQIMQRVAENQDRSDAERKHYVYQQRARAASHRGHKVMCEETTESRITPTPEGSQHQLLTLQGRRWHQGTYQTYDHPLFQPPPGQVHISNQADDDTDVDLVESMRRDTLTDENSKDGFNAGLFPLTGKALPSYDYHLVKRETMNGRDTFHITFQPKDHSDFDWKGDAWIDTTAYQPVLVRTRLSRGVPFLVKTMLGTNVPGLGFSVTYQPQPDGTWFPVTFGTEFKIHVLFLFSRQITIDATNHDFQKTHVDSKILGAELKEEEPQ